MTVIAVAVAWQRNSFLIVALVLALVMLPSTLVFTRLLVRPAVAVLHRAHSGHVGDYVAWMFAGLTVLAVVLGMQLR